MIINVKETTGILHHFVIYVTFYLKRKSSHEIGHTQLYPSSGHPNTILRELLKNDDWLILDNLQQEQYKAYKWSNSLRQYILKYIYQRNCISACHITILLKDSNQPSYL